MPQGPLPAALTRAALSRAPCAVHKAVRPQPGRGGPELSTCARAGGSTPRRSDMWRPHTKNRPRGSRRRLVAVEEGFEPSKGCPLPAFEAGAIGH